ncbi:MAG: hypothetical protein C0622_04480 [Desulfuromonas sp.]|nr:MAG: hypothetical protein C0622_04480 [Desulfuromonas sp.]
MQAVGLITEYNPFHNGHLHHLHESLQLSGAAVAVAVMSGHFLQRGEPALVDKWLRAEMALAAGVDLVIDLPLPWACSSAPDFARGGVQALEGLGGIGALCFGSEAGEIEPLQRWAALVDGYDEQLTDGAASLLRAGKTFPRARAELLAELTAEQGGVPPESPNDILGLAYLRALAALDSSMRPLTTRRIGAGYHETGVGDGQIASATGIRARLRKGDEIAELLPEPVLALLREGLYGGRQIVEERYFLLLLAELLRNRTELERVWLVENGIHNRLIEVADRAATLEDLVAGIKARQLTRTRIQRMLVAILLGLERDTATALLASGPRYLHLLAASAKGERFLAATRKERSLPLVQDFSRIYARLKRHYGMESKEYRLALQQLELEQRATRIYSLLTQAPHTGSRNRDFYRPLIRGKGDNH